MELLRRRMSSDEINALPLWHYSGSTVIIRNLEDWRKSLDDINNSEILGFDTETRPCFCRGKTNPPALIQIATSACVYLLQLTWFPFCKEIANTLENTDIIKAGIGIADDMHNLGKLHSFIPSNIVDLGKAARDHGIPNQGLRNLSALFFGYRISKGQQCSNWNLKELSSRQIAYAATDAWMSRMIFLRMREFGLL